MRYFLALIMCMSFMFTHGQESEVKFKDQVYSVDAIIENLYDVISGEKGEPRDWDLFRQLFYSDAKLIPSGPNQEGLVNARFMTPDDYVEGAAKWLLDNGFFEREIHRVTQSFGSLTHVFSTYEAFRSDKDEKPFMRGINSIQLMNDGERWWIINIYWTQEREGNAIPKKFLPDN
ncbi:MAG: hypothetical protein HKO90_03850 [Flavobacteriaceae bacterium]|nr:hypothetical protein [Flavobacteriaceae bacterium]